MTKKETGFIVADTVAIYGMGDTKEAAIADYEQWSSERFVDDKIDGTPLRSARVQPATAALLAQVEAEGGDIAWDTIDGIACVKGGRS